MITAKEILDPICPMCLTLFAPGQTDGFFCPGCRTGKMPVQLMDRKEYLQQVDFDKVRLYWENSQSSEDLRRRMLDRIQLLQQLQKQGG